MLTHPTLTPYPSVDVAGLVDEEDRGGGGVLGLPTCLSACVCVCLSVRRAVGPCARLCVLITRCWYGNLSVVVSSSAAGPLPGPGCPAVPAPSLPCRLGSARLGVLSPWRRPTVTFHLCSVRPYVCPPCCVALCPAACVSARARRGPLLILLLLLLLLLAVTAPPPPSHRKPAAHRVA